MQSRTLNLKSEIETAKFATEIAESLQSGVVLLLNGELGAGKTAFTRFVVNYFDKKVEVTSPSYSLINIYPTNPQIFHIDLFRLESDNDLDDLGLEDYLEPDGITIIEWADKFQIKPYNKYYQISFDIISEQERKVIIEEYN